MEGKGCCFLVLMALYCSPLVLVWLSEVSFWTKILMTILLIWNVVSVFIAEGLNNDKKMTVKTWLLGVLAILPHRLLFAYLAVSHELYYLKIFSIISIVFGLIIVISTGLVKIFGKD